jgi:hypothetical protein
VREEGALRQGEGEEVGVVVVVEVAVSEAGYPVSRPSQHHHLGEEQSADARGEGADCQAQ